MILFTVERICILKIQTLVLSFNKILEEIKFNIYSYRLNNLNEVFVRN